MNQSSRPAASHPIGEGYRNALITVNALGVEYLGEVSLWGEVRYRHSSQNVDSLIQLLRGWVDHYYRQEISNRHAKPTPLDYQLAATRVYPLLSSSQQQLLKYHANCQGFEAPVELLLAAAQVCSYTQLLLEYSAIARRLSDALFYIPDLNADLIDPIVRVLLQATHNESSVFQQQTLILAFEAGEAFRHLIENTG